MSEIIKGAPIPPKGYRVNGGSKNKYGLMGLEVGDSIQYMIADLPDDGRLPCHALLHTRLTSIVAFVRRQTGRTFTTRKIDGGIQVWRVS